ncbi:MAG: histidine kinase N-terminal 7TM domain-containing protein [Candidatus Limnocylindrales bacterium]
MVLTPEHLEVIAHSLTAVLGAWLGLTVLTRSRTSQARMFAFLALALVAWSSSVIVQRLATSPGAGEVAHGLEELAAAVIVPATAHFSLMIASEGHPSRRRLWWLAVGYVLNISFALPGIVNRGAPIAIGAPNLDLGIVPGAMLGWAWILVRLVTLLVASGWLLGAWRHARSDALRRRQLGLTLATVGIGALGGIIRLLSVVGATDPWIGVSMVTLAMVLSAAVVFSAGVFFAPEIAGRAFWTSLVLGLGLFLVVGVLLVVDAASRRLLGLDLPLLTVIALVVTVAVYEPAAAWGRARMGGRSPGAIARERLLVALGQPGMGARTAAEGVQPALTRLASALDLAGASVVLPDGSVAATEGSPPDPATSPAIALIARDELIGELRVGRTLSGEPLSPVDEELLRLSAAYVAAALRTGRREDEQAAALTGLTHERAEVEAAATDLHDALVRRGTTPPGLRVHALGPLRVERGDTLIERWGGEKAGTRQALALFAFLFDRGERGLAKDEALELIWPDTDIERADLAFHRTLGGLRHTLDPGPDGGKRAVRFQHDRYRLDPAVVAWSDMAAFQARLDEARAAPAGPERVRLLEEARRLYRGEYLDDCPFYGDSVHVEERRASLRGRAVDLLVVLGESYEAAGDRASSAAAYRDAIGIALEPSLPAEAGLARVGGAR